MKTMAKMMAVFFLAGLFASSCATVSRLNTEYEEEMTRVEKMSPEEKAEWEKNKPFAFDYSDIDRDTGD